MNAELSPLKIGEHNSENESTIDRVITPLTPGSESLEHMVIKFCRCFAWNETLEDDKLNEFGVSSWLAIRYCGQSPWLHSGFMGETCSREWYSAFSVLCIKPAGVTNICVSISMQNTEYLCNKKICLIIRSIVFCQFCWASLGCIYSTTTLFFQDLSYKRPLSCCDE